MRTAAILLSLILLAPIQTFGESQVDSEIAILKAQFADMQKRIAALERENAALRENQVPQAASAPAQPALQSKQFNPDIGVIGDIVATSTESDEDEEGNDRVSVRHVELVFSHDVDPYSRFDFVAAFSDFEDPAVEVAALSYWGLPYDTRFRIGRFLPRIGRAVALHRDQLESVDEPLVIQRYFGLEGLQKTGFELSNYLPFPWDDPAHEITFGMLEGGNGEDGETFGSSHRRPTYYARLRNGLVISDFSNLDLGTTALIGSSDDDSNNEVKMFGVDLAVNTSLDAVRRLRIVSEAFFQDRDEGEERSPWGVYGLIDYRFAQRWSVGSRYDFVEPIEAPEERSRRGDSAISAMLTFHQSEFARWRFQYQHVDFAEGDDDNRFFLQATVAIGVHKHDLQ